jgi:ribonuclease BN (tRNA processing enzyme)
MITKSQFSLILILAIITFSSCVSSRIPGSQQPQTTLPSQQTGIVLLGTGTPNADPGRMGPSLAIIVKDKSYIVDCGTGLVRRASAAYKKGIPSLKPSRLDTLFITHLHSDHTLGLPDIMLTPGVLSRMKPFKIFGPPGTGAMVRYIQQAYREDVDVRLEGLEPANQEGYVFLPQECAPGRVYQDKHVSVTAFAARHGAWKHAYGFRFDTPGLVICVSGDTAPYPEMEENYQNCDVLIHEVYSKTGFNNRPPAWQAYHAASHTSGVQLGKIAANVKPRLLILIHQLMWGATEKQLLDEIRQHFDGPVIYGNDLDYISFAGLQFKLTSLAKTTAQN